MFSFWQGFRTGSGESRLGCYLEDKIRQNQMLTSLENRNFPGSVDAMILIGIFAQVPYNQSSRASYRDSWDLWLCFLGGRVGHCIQQQEGAQICAPSRKLGTGTQNRPQGWQDFWKINQAELCITLWPIGVAHLALCSSFSGLAFCLKEPVSYSQQFVAVN